MSKTIEKIIVKHGCDYNCNVDCGFEKFNGGDTAEVVFKGSWEQCRNETRRLYNLAGIEGNIQHCYYSGGEASEKTYTHEQGYLIKGNQDSRCYCFIAKDNTDAFMSYEVTEQTTEEIIEKDKKTFRPGMLSHVIRKSPRKIE